MFALTLDGVYKNIEFLLDQYKAKEALESKKRNENASFSVSPTDVPYEQLKSVETGSSTLAWDDIVVCIVADGRQKCPQNVKVALEMMGCYQSDEKIMVCMDSF